jgi:filamentous hemagglutinin family protein
MKVLRKFSKKCFSARKFIVGFLVSCMFFNVPMSVVLAGPEGAQVVNGQVSFQQSGYNTTITASDKSIINYSSFDIGRPEIVEFIQPGSNASVLNRILSANPTNINGTLLANGRVFFVNPAGVYIGGGARVNVNQLVASGLNITNSDFINGNYNFAGGNGSVINSGDITAEKVYLIGRQVANSGSISCPAGYVVMASGERVFLGEPGSDVVVEVEAPLSPESANPVESSGVLNEGTIDAAGGKIILAAAGDIYSQAISNVGSLSVSSETGDAGQVELSADGGKVTNTGTIEAKSDSGKGGTVQVLGDRVGLLDAAEIDVSGFNGGGTVLIGGDYQGKGDVPTASRTYVSKDSAIKADATENGDGGKVIVWADEITAFYGNISARGGADGGDGGFAEVSGKDGLIYEGSTVLSAPQGMTGTLMLDPGTVTIADTGTNDSQLDDQEILKNNGPHDADWTISNEKVEDELDNADVRIQALTSITVDYPVDASGNTNTNNLTLGAPTINLKDPITLMPGADLLGEAGNATTYVSENGLIANAIDLTESYGTVNVAAGTYNEDLTITTDGLELAGASDAEPWQTVIQGVSKQFDPPFPDATNSTNVDIQADEIEIHGFKFLSPLADASIQEYSSGIVLKGTDIEIHHNIFETQQDATSGSGTFNGDTSVAIQTYSGEVSGHWPVDISGLYIHDNKFEGTPANGYYGVYINPQDQLITASNPVRIENNEFTGTIWRAITTERSYTDILNNTITTSTSSSAGSNSGIRVVNWAGDNVNSVTIQDNEVAGAASGQGFGFGIGLGTGYGDSLTDVIVTENEISGDHVLGVQVNSPLSNVTIEKNSLTGGTTTLDLQNTTAAAVDASGNWWGSSDEATIQSRISNTGGGSVEHSPWLGIAGSSTTDPFDYTPDLSSIYTSTSIQDAIDLAASGATINVIAGTYTESVNVNKQLAGLYFIGGAPSEIDGTLTLSDDVASNTGVDIYTQNDGDLTLNDIVDGDTHSLLVDTESLNTTDGQINLDGSVEADGGITITGGIVNVGDSASDKVNSDGAVSITGTGAVTVDAEIDPTTISITSYDDVAINNTVTADNLITVTGGTDGTGSVNLNAGGSLSLDKTNPSTSIGVTAADAITMTDGTVIDADTGTLTLLADDDIAISRLVTTNNTATAVSINSTSGAVTDAGDNGGADIDATGGADAQVTISAVTGIGAGTGGAIETAVRKIAASTVGAAAHIDIDNASVSATELTSISTTGTDADITFDQTGGGELTLTSVTTTDGTIDVSAASGNIIATLVTAGTDGDILLDTTSSGNITLGSLTAADDQITINSAGAIYDSAVDSVTDLKASALVLDAVTGIGGGVGDEIETDAATLDATVGGTGDIDLKEKDAIELVDVDTSDGNIRIEADGQIAATDVEAGGAGDVELTTTSGNVLVDDVKASGNQIKIDSDGAIEESVVSDSSVDLTASNLVLDAVTGIGGGVGNEIETEVATLDATVSGTGDIDLKEKDAIELVDVDTSDGNIRIEADGQITATDVEAGGAGVGDGNIGLKTTSGSVLVGNLTAADDQIMISSAGAIGEVLDDPEAVDLSAKELNLSAQTGITGQSPIETSATDIKASTDSGDIDIDNDNASPTAASLEVTPGAGNILFSQTGGGELDIEAQTADGDIDIDVANANLIAGNITAGSTGNVTLEALQGGMSGGTITANGGTLIMKQQDSLNLKDLAFGNQANTDLTVESGSGSFTADNTVAANAADKWQSITATAQSDISLEGTGNINTNALVSANGNIQIRSTSGGINAAGNITANNGGLTMTAGGNVTTNVVNPTNGNIQIRSTSGGDLIINNDLTSNQGGVSLISDLGKIYTPGSFIDVDPGPTEIKIPSLNVKITGYSDGVNGVPLPFGPGVAAIVIKCGDGWSFNPLKYDYLGLDSGATLTAKGTYNTANNDLDGVSFIGGDPIDVAIYLGNPKLYLSQKLNGVSSPDMRSNILDMIKYPGTMDVDVRSKVAAIGDNGAMVIDGVEAVSFVGSGSLFETAPSAFNTTNSLQVVSRISQSLNEAVNPGGSPSPRLPYAGPVNIDNIKSWYTGEYVLRGETVLAKILGMIQAVPLVPPMPLEPEIEGELEEPDMEAIAQLLEELGIGVQPFLARAYRPSLNTDLTLLKAAEKLLRLGPILEDDTRFAALVPLIRGISETPVPIEEQMTSFVQELSRQELAGQWMNALTEYVAVLNNEIGWPANTSVARVMRKYGAKLTGPAERLFVQMYLERSFGG